MLKIQVRTIQGSRWLGPVVVLAALALIPFALALGLAAMALVTGLFVLRFFLPSGSGNSREDRAFENNRRKVSDLGSNVLDADYEVRDESEKRN